MARLVREVMNKELFSLKPTDSADLALAGILAFGITGAPVVGEDERPVGMVSLRDLADTSSGKVAERMRGPALTIHQDESLTEAGRMLADSGRHRLVVVDDLGRAVGNLSALDIIRGLLGLPSACPSAFSHLDPETGLVWTDELQLTAEKTRLAPEGPGLLVLIHGGASLPETPVWVEEAADVRGRLEEMLLAWQVQPLPLARLLDEGRLRFRAAACADPKLRAAILGSLKARASAAPGADRDAEGALWD